MSEVEKGYEGKRRNPEGMACAKTLSKEESWYV